MPVPLFVTAEASPEHVIRDCCCFPWSWDHYPQQHYCNQRPVPSSVIVHITVCIIISSVDRISIIDFNICRSKVRMIPVCTGIPRYLLRHLYRPAEYPSRRSLYFIYVILRTEWRIIWCKWNPAEYISAEHIPLLLNRKLFTASSMFFDEWYLTIYIKDRSDIFSPSDENSLWRFYSISKHFV